MVQLRKIEGHFDAKGLRFAIVASSFNKTIVDELLKGAQDCFKRHSCDQEIPVYHVPGAFEVPLIAKKLAQTKRYHAILCLGAVIRGETPHFDYVAGQAASGILQAGLSTDTPVIFSILTTDTREQAVERAGGKCGNNGFSGALSAIEMANLIKSI